MLNRKFSRKLPYGVHKVSVTGIKEEVVRNKERVVVTMDIPGYGTKRTFWFSEEQVEIQLAGILAQLDIDVIESVDELEFPFEVDVNFQPYQGEGYATAIDSWNFDTTVLEDGSDQESNEESDLDI